MCDSIGLCVINNLCLKEVLWWAGVWQGIIAIKKGLNNNKIKFLLKVHYAVFFVNLVEGAVFKLRLFKCITFACMLIYSVYHFGGDSRTLYFRPEVFRKSILFVTGWSFR